MRTLILGFDSFDPATFERLAAQGRLPNLSHYVAAGKYAHLAVSDPPQTEVSWTSIATGLNPGGHGIFDFVHRDPATYIPFVSLLPTQANLLGVQFTPPYTAHTIFDEAAQQGYPATTLWWPGTFPARPQSPVRTIPGLGTPDILGKLGVGALYTTDAALADHRAAGSPQKTAVVCLKKTDGSRYSAAINGPMMKKGKGVAASAAEMQLDIDDEHIARLVVGKQVVPLQVGQWSDIFEVPFKLSLFFSIRAVTRAILTQVEPEARLYLLPLQIHPLASAWRYATPPAFVRQTWQACGPYLTLGWPQDTTGLEEGCISDDQFLQLCDSIFAGRQRLLMHLLDSFQEGILAAVFDSLDRVQHMFWRDRPDVVERWYQKLDGLVGAVEQRLQATGQKKARLFVLSDHGFSDFRYKVHLNRWLGENGYLAARTENGSGSLTQVDWARSQAYAVGLNSLYLNQVNREGQGCVLPEERASLLARLRDLLLGWRGLDGRPVVQRVLTQDEAFSGPYTDYGPDLLIGYSPGYRASSETGLGAWKNKTIEQNRDHWGADHCIDSLSVPGVIFCNQGLQGLAQPSYRDIPALTIGKQLEQNANPPARPPSSTSGEDREILEERLKSLGYL